MQQRPQLGTIDTGFYPETVPDLDPARAYIAWPGLRPDELRLIARPITLRWLPPLDEVRTIPPYRPSQLVELLRTRYGDDPLSYKWEDMLTRLAAGDDGFAQLAVEATALGFGDLPPQQIIHGIGQALRQRTYQRVYNFAEYVRNRRFLWVAIDVLERNAAGVPYWRVVPACGLTLVDYGDDRLARAVGEGKGGVMGKIRVVKGVFEALMDSPSQSPGPRRRRK